MIETTKWCVHQACQTKALNQAGPLSRIRLIISFLCRHRGLELELADARADLSMLLYQFGWRHYGS